MFQGQLLSITRTKRVASIILYKIEHPFSVLLNFFNMQIKSLKTLVNGPICYLEISVILTTAKQKKQQTVKPTTRNSF